MSGSEFGLNLADYAAAVLAASVHAGKHEPEVKFVKENLRRCNRCRPQESHRVFPPPVSFVSARTTEDAIVMLVEWDNAEGAEISHIRDFMIDFQLNDEGDLQLEELLEAAVSHS
jgi:hypothetical protein